MKYKIYYSFDGIANTTVEAKNEEEARELFMNGDWDEKIETIDEENYEIDLIEEEK